VTIRLLIVGAVFSGCFPLRAQVRAPRQGRVVDASSGAVIRDATVIVESWQVPTPPGYSYHRELLHTVEVRTNEAGAWSVPEEKDWKLAILAADGFPVFIDTACVFAPGYDPFIMNPWAAESNASTDYFAGREVLQTRVPQDIQLRRNPLRRTITVTPTTRSRCGLPERPFE
jgi:hypothetical protein